MKIHSKESAHFFWHGSPLSLYEMTCIQSFVRNGFIVHIWAFDEINIPEGAKLCNAEKYFSKNEILDFTQGGKKGSITSFSNAFRYRLLTQEEGWWFDLDCLCMKEEKEFCKLKQNRQIVAGWEDSFKVNSGVLCFPNIQLARKALALYEKIAHLKQKNFVWGDIGPKLITQLVIENNLIGDICSRSCFYPLHYLNATHSIDPEYYESVRSASDKSFIFHYWNEYFTQLSIDKSIYPPKGSFLHNEFVLSSLSSRLKPDIHSVLEDISSNIDIVAHKVSSIERNSQIADLIHAVNEGNQEILRLNQAIEERDMRIKLIYSSSSWRLTKILRFFESVFARIGPVIIAGRELLYNNYIDKTRKVLIKKNNLRKKYMKYLAYFSK